MKIKMREITTNKVVSLRSIGGLLRELRRERVHPGLKYEVMEADGSELFDDQRQGWFCYETYFFRFFPEHVDFLVKWYSPPMERDKYHMLRAAVRQINEASNRGETNK